MDAVRIEGRIEGMHEMPLRKPATRIGSDDRTDIIGEFDFPFPVTPANIAAFEDSCTWCFQAHRVELLRLFLSRDRKRAVLLFRAPDAESVRLVCRRAAMGVERIHPAQP